uniref:Zinc finger, HIT-type containing 3 n=1 Tax=Sphaeramia orbicularis TaxID=375764 RepID=A0A673AVM2_9TELE
MQVCNVCREQTPKYKCPTCKIRYCSVGCYKKHKGKYEECQSFLMCHMNLNLESVSAVCTDPWSVEDLLNEDDIIDKVPVEKLQLLGTLRDLLRNPHLRQLLRSVDAADSKEDAIEGPPCRSHCSWSFRLCLNIVEDGTAPTHT